jgi:rubrerythrin
MKKRVLNVAIVATSLFVISCNHHTKDHPVDKACNPAMVENIQYVIVAEQQSSANNKAYAQKATEENHNNVAKLFSAKSKADSIRAEKHKAVLASMTDTTKLAPRPAVKKVQPKTTSENLKQSINDDEYQVAIVYPNYIEQAVMAGDSLTVVTLQWAADGRKNDQKYGLAVLESVTKNGNDMSVSDTWYVCPICGSISDSISKAGTKNCNECGVVEEDFIVVNN